MRGSREDNTFMRSSQSDADGFIMVVLLIVMGITAVWMAADMPAWKQQATREKEAELVFRGQQYVRALRLYQSKNGPGSAPTEVDALVTGKFLRKKFKDPITNDDFEVVYRATAPIVPGQSPPGTQQPSPGRPGGAGTAPVQPPAGRAQQPPGAQTGPGAGQGSGQNFGGPITGVRSKSTASSIMLYLGATHYNEWQFLYSGQTQQGGGPNRGGGPGAQPGGPGGPGGVGPGIGGGAGRGGPPGGVQGPGRGGGPTGGAPAPGRGRGGL